MSKSVFSDPYSALLVMLIAARKAAGLTQVQLAERLGKPQSYLSKLERAERRIDVVEFAELAAALGISPTELFESFIRRTNERERTG